jgi:hypothetical protein
MELLLVVAVLGVGAYQFFKLNTARGVETVRSYVFLDGVLSGHPVSEANAVAAYDVASGPTDIIQNAMVRVSRDYGGEQLSMIADAYKEGMTPRLPFWYRTLAAIHPAGRGGSIGADFLADASSARQGSGNTDFQRYLRMVTDEVKRLDGKADGELHWLELTDYEAGARRAFRDGVDPLALAAALRSQGMPLTTDLAN